MKLFYNCHLYNHPDNAFVEDKGKIIAIGKYEEFYDTYETAIDLQGKYVYPGFNDSHMHLVNYGQCLSRIMLDQDTYSLAALLNKLKAHLNDSYWIVGRGWNHDYFQDVHRFPTREDLDCISTSQPIVIVRTCGHVAVCNSKALEYVTLKDVEGGSYHLDTGLFEENAVNLLTDAIPQATVEDIKGYILKAQKALHRYGVTSVQSDDLISATHDYHDALQAFQELNAERRLTLRIYEQCQLENKENLSKFLQEGYKTGAGDDFFKIGPLKIIGDGSLGARTAALSKPYADDEATQGMKIYSKDQLQDYMTYAHNHGMQIAVHGIGDGVIDDILHIYKELIHDQNTMRHGLVHCQITQDKHLELFKKLNIHAYIQTPFLDYDNHIVVSRVGKELAKTSYNFKTLYQQTSCSNGSDCPVEVPDVMGGLQLAITRESLDGTVFLKEQALSIKEAIDSYTKGGAYSSFEENQKGSLQEGMFCDFVVLDECIEESTPHHIKDIKILQTYVSGDCVYENKE